MNIPVKIENTTTCEVCKAVETACDRLLTDLSPAMRLDGEDVHVVASTLRWALHQHLTRFDGNIQEVVGFITGVLNEPQAERLVHAYLTRTAQELDLPPGPVH